MELNEIVSIVSLLVDPTNVLALLGSFSILAKIFPAEWQWDDKLIKWINDRPEALQNGVKTLLRIVHLLGLTKKVK